MIKPEVFEQVNAELVRMRRADAVRLSALFFDEEGGNLAEIRLESGIRALAARCGAEVETATVAGYGKYQFRVGNVLYSQSVPRRRDGAVSESAE